MLMDEETQPSRKAQQGKDALVKLILNTMNEYEDGATFDMLADGVADSMIKYVLSEIGEDNHWAEIYFLKQVNKKLRAKVWKMVRKYKNIRDENDS